MYCVYDVRKKDVEYGPGKAWRRFRADVYKA